MSKNITQQRYIYIYIYIYIYYFVKSFSVIEAIINYRRFSVKKVSLKFFQNSQKNTCIEIKTTAEVFSFEFCGIFKNTLFKYLRWLFLESSIINESSFFFYRHMFSLMYGILEHISKMKNHVLLIMKYYFK